jgi:parvulin-like peptidyl-prolyl isomerase
VVLKVGDEAITQEQIERAIRALPPQAQNSLTRQGKKPFGDEYVLMLVLSHEAVSNHLDDTPDYKETLALTRLKILAQQEYQQIVQRAAVTPDETSKYFAAHQSDYDELQVLQITVRKKPEGSKEGTPGFPPEEAKARAEEIRQAFIAGQDAKQVAERFQMANVVRVDSQPITIRRGQMRPDMEKAAFDLKPGQVSEIFDFGMSMGFIRVISHQTEDLKTATAKIEATLRQQKINSALEGLKANAKIWMDDAFFTSPPATQVPPRPASTPGAAAVPK